MRLEQIVFSQGFGTRRECRGLIALGRVAINGEVCTDASTDFDPVGVTLTVDGEDWPWFEKVILMMNKPAGYECSQKPIHHPSVMKLLPAPLRVRGVRSVGRLDEDTTGLLIFTDDGALIHRLTHPKRHVPKRYRVFCKHAVSPAMVAKLESGVMIEGEKASVAAGDVSVLDEKTLEMTISSGKYHQVRRMIAAASNRVERLHRTGFGALTLPEDLKNGQWRFLPGPEVFYSGAEGTK